MIGKIVFFLVLLGIMAFSAGHQVGQYDGQLDYPREKKKMKIGLRLILLLFSVVCYPFGLSCIGYRAGYKLGQKHYFDYRHLHNLSILQTRWHHTD
jgi:hypothetical protein